MGDGNQNQMSAVNTTLNGSHRPNHTLQDAQIEEKFSLNALKLFVSHCCQVMGLWRILCEHQFHVLIGSLPANHQQVFQNTTFKDLFLYGHDVCSLLITALVDSYLGDNASVDSISAKLREVCPNLYRFEDAAFSKVCFFFVLNVKTDYWRKFRQTRCSSRLESSKIWTKKKKWCRRH